MLASLQRGHGGRGVLIPHRGDAHGFQFGIGEHRVVVGEDFRRAELLLYFTEPLRIAGADCVKLHVGNRSERFTMFFTKPAETEDTVFYFFHRSGLC